MGAGGIGGGVLRTRHNWQLPPVALNVRKIQCAAFYGGLVGSLIE